MFAPVQLSKQLFTIFSFSRHEVAQVPDVIIVTHDLVPVCDERSIVLSYGRKRSAVDTKYTGISEMRVASEEIHADQTN